MYCALTSNIECNKVIHKIFQIDLHVSGISGYFDNLSQNIIRNFLIFRNCIESLHYAISADLTHATNTFSIAFSQIGMDKLKINVNAKQPSEHVTTRQFQTNIYLIVHDDTDKHHSNCVL